MAATGSHIDAQSHEGVHLVCPGLALCAGRVSRQAQRDASEQPKAARPVLSAGYGNEPKARRGQAAAGPRGDIEPPSRSAGTVLSGRVRGPESKWSSTRRESRTACGAIRELRLRPD
jgi:hypothetical protein